MNVPIFDERPSRDRDGTLPPELDEDQDIVQRMRDELLFEQYGGRVADYDAETSPPGDDPRPGNDHPGPNDFSVPAFVLARQHLAIVDNWAEQVKQLTSPATGDFEQQLLRRDGELLIEAFKRQAGRDGKKGAAMAIGAELAAEEMALRLKHFPEA